MELEEKWKKVKQLDHVTVVMNLCRKHHWEVPYKLQRQWRLSRAQTTEKQEPKLEEKQEDEQATKVSVALLG